MAAIFRRGSYEMAQTQRRPWPRALAGTVALRERPVGSLGSQCRGSKIELWRRAMKIIAPSLLVLGLLAVQVSEANAVVCARGVYRAGCGAPEGVGGVAR